MKKLAFPNNFLFGTATASYQVEGGNIYSDWEDFYPAGPAKEFCGARIEKRRRI
ncbi:MAG: family 1 glycosylhydrolase [Candidatus Pacebacteria bacterium]|nr:family 1 glycosylhydrolase [Candidatus Paceibacterota bacterium]